MQKRRYLRSYKIWKFPNVRALDLLPLKQPLFEGIGAMQAEAKIGILTKGKTKFWSFLGIKPSRRRADFAKS